MSFLDKIKAFGRQQASDDSTQVLNSTMQGGKFDRQMADTVTMSESSRMGTSTMVGGSSIISEAVPTGTPTEFADSQASERRPGPSVGRLALIGGLTPAAQQRVLTVLMALGALGVAAALGLSLHSANRVSAQLDASSQALMQSQRLAKSVWQAVAGDAQAFAQVRESAAILAAKARGLKSGEGEVPQASEAVRSTLEPLLPMIERADKSAKFVVAHEQGLIQVAQAVVELNRQSSDLQTGAEAASTQKPASAEALNSLAALSPRIGRSIAALLSQDGVNAELRALAEKDLGAFQAISEGLNGAAAKEVPGKERLQALLKQHEQTRLQAQRVLDHLPDLMAARRAQADIASDSEPLRVGLQRVQQGLQQESGVPLWALALLGGSVLMLVLGSLGFLRLFIYGQAQRAASAERQKAAAERQEQEAKRVNDANQAAILRLMNELQLVAEGDLTQQATVTEDITGAIADSVNYTVEELRTLVAQVQGTAARVTDTTLQVDQTSTELLAASTEQLHEIRGTGEAVLQMAGRINEVSSQAQQTASVAQRSRAAAELGLLAMQNTIEGMNAIRDQIQETSKRIKRLGESSQEIGEITELISDITEQTNVLALNAAIQAASAGEAGRGFSVVAEEVQRLAERSGDATRRIAALVKTIQTDTQDATAAMERSTQNVVEGTKLSDAAGTALTDIDEVSRQLSDLIVKISDQALGEARLANEVAANIQHIFAVTEQTGEGTRSTAQMVHELSRTAEELRASVSRFKIA